MSSLESRRRPVFFLGDRIEHPMVLGIPGLTKVWGYFLGYSNFLGYFFGVL